MKTEFYVEKAKFNPFTSQLELQNVIVGSQENPFLKAKKSQSYVNIFSLFNRIMEFKIRDIYIEDIDINLIKNKKGKWSIPWHYKTVPPKEKVQFSVDFTNIKISNMNIKYQQNIGLGDSPLESEMNDLNVSLKHLKNESLSTIIYDGKISIKSSTTGIVNSGNITGRTDVKLSDWCIPSLINISSLISDISIGSNAPEISNRKISFELDIKRDLKNPLNNKINYFRIKDIINNKSDSKVNASGQLNFYPFDLKMNINANPVHAPTLRIYTNLLGNFDLGNAVFSYLGGLSVSSDNLKTAGEVSITKAVPTINDFQITYGIPLDFILNYSIDFDFSKKTLLLKRLFSVLSKQKEEIIRVTLNKPMLFNKKKRQVSTSKLPPTIKIRTSKLNLNSFNKIFNKRMKILSGILDSDISLSTRSNNDLIIKGTTKTQNTQIEIKKNGQLINTDLDQTIDVEIQNYKNIKINKYELKVTNNSKKAANVKISGNYNIKTKKGKLHTLIPYINQNLINTYQSLPNKIESINLILENLSSYYLYIDNKLAVDFNKSNLFNVEKLRLVFSNLEKDSSITLSLQNHFTFNLNKNNIVLQKDIIFKSDVKNLDIVNIIESLPVNFPLKFSDGNFTYKLLFIIPKEMDSLQLKGQIALLYSNLSFYDQYIRNLSITSDINAVIFDTKAVNLIDTYSELYLNGVQCLKAKTNGVLAFNKTDDTSLIISIEDINKYFTNLFYDGISVNITQLEGKGKIFCRLTPSKNTSLVKGELNITKAVFGENTDATPTPTIAYGDLKFNFLGKDKRININNINISLQGDANEIAQLDVSGSFPIPLKSGKANLDIISDNIMLDKIIPIYKHLTKEINKTFVDEEGQFAPYAFYGLDLDGVINFKSISFGKLINSEFLSKLSIKDDVLSLDQKKSHINGTKVKYHGELKTNHKRGYPFAFNAEFTNLDMKPFIKTFVLGNYTKSGGTVDSFTFNLSGKGFSKKNIDKNLKGYMDIKLSNLSLPYQINTYSAIKFLLGPLIALEQTRQMLPGGFLVNNFEKGIEDTQNILDNKDNINLKSGIIMLTCDNGIIKLKKVGFSGNTNDIINYSDFYGTIDYNGNLDIYSDSNISGIKVPFYIEGTIDKPTPNFTYFFIPKFIALNILTILNPINIFDFTLDIFIGIYKTLEGTAIWTWNLIISPFSSDETEKTEESTPKTSSVARDLDTSVLI